MTTEQNKDIVRRFYEGFETSNNSALMDLLSADLVAYSHGVPGPQNREVHLQGISGWNAAFGETRFTIEEQIAEGDTVASRVTMRSIHNGGEFQGLAPSGKQIVISAITIERIEDGKIVERRVFSDWLGMMQQLGLVPPPQAAG